MKLNQDGINPEDKQLAISVRNYLISGNRVIGDPGEGLRQTLQKLEAKKQEQESVGITEWVVKDSELASQIAMTKAGIEGEEKLCDYLQTLIKYDDKLSCIVAFASLSYNLDSNTKDYIPDTDTLLVCGNNILIIDAKNLKTKPNQALMLMQGVVVDADKGKEVLAVHPSTHIWENIFNNADIPYNSIDGYVCIVNDVDTEIIKNEEWYECHNKLIHIAELKEILEEWVDGISNKTLSLKMLTEISKAQIKKEKELSFDVNALKRKFGI